MLHLLYQHCGLWPPEQPLDVALACAKAHAAHPGAPAKALGTLRELVRVLGTLAAERSPLASAPAHVTGDYAHTVALSTGLGVHCKSLASLSTGRLQGEQLVQYRPLTVRLCCGRPQKGGYACCDQQRAPLRTVRASCGREGLPCCMVSCMVRACHAAKVGVPRFSGQEQALAGGHERLLPGYKLCSSVFVTGLPGWSVGTLLTYLKPCAGIRSPAELGHTDCEAGRGGAALCPLLDCSARQLKLNQLEQHGYYL